MKLLKILFFIIVGLIVILSVVGLFLPKTAHLERSIVIKASQEKVFNQVNSFKNFNTWSPWYGLDPDAKYTYSEIETGVGAKMEWSSKMPSVGTGVQEIIESRYPDYVKNKLIFGDGAENSGSFLLEKIGANETKVTWAFDGNFESSIVDRYFGLMLENLLGPQYEQGLKNLKKTVEL